jgi:tetratricopeptide (TPR) repeat protein/AraC-like DNA-binding protein
MTAFFRKIIISTLFFIIYFSAIGQKIDSPYNEIEYAKHDSVKARLYYECGKLYQKEFPDSAMFFYQKSIEYADKAGRLEYKSRSSINLGNLYSRIMLFDESIVLLKEAVKIDTKLENLERKHLAYTNLISIFFNMGELDSAKFYARKAFQVAHETKNKVAISTSYLGMGGILDYEGKPDSALFYYRKSLDVLKGSKNYYLFAVGYNNIGSTHSRKGDYQESIANFEKAIEFCELSSSKLILGLCYRNLGFDYSTLAEYDKSLNYFHKALQTYEQIDNQAGIASCYEHIGGVYFEMGDYKDAHIYYKKCLNIQEGQKDYNLVYAMHKRIGELYQKQKNNEKALESFDKALKVAEKSGVQHYIVLAYLNVGGVLADLGNYEESMRLLEKALTQARKNKFKEQIGKGLISIAKVQILWAKEQLSINQRNEYLYGSISNLKEALTITKEIKATDETAKALKNLSLAYELLNNHKRALQYNKLYNVTRDSIMDIEKYKTISELEIKYQIEQKELQIEKQEIELKKKQQAIQFYIIVLFILATGIFFISLIYRKKQKAYRKLAEKNIEAAKKCVSEDTNQKIYEFSEKQQEIFKKLNLTIKNDQVYTDIELTIDGLAKLIQTNRTELSQVVKKFSDKTYPVFINEQRIKHAIRLLVDFGTKYSIDGIAKESGFKSTSNFYKIFKENTGMTPAEFQKSLVA